MPENKSVCKDLIGRLESQLPNAVVMDENGQLKVKKPLSEDFPLQEDDTAVKGFPPVDLGPEVLYKPVESARALKDPEPAPEPSRHGPILEGLFNMNQADAYSALKEIVGEFNEKLDAWYEAYGCVVNFGWGYANGKKLEISGIDFIVYRKPAPSAESIKSVLAKAKI